MRPNSSKFDSLVSSWMAFGSILTETWVPRSVSNLNMSPPCSLMRAKPSHLALGFEGELHQPLEAKVLP